VADETKNVSVSKITSIPGNPNKFTMYIILGLIALLIMVMVMATVLILTFSNIKPRPVYIQGNSNNQNQTGIMGSADDVGSFVPLNEVIVNLSAADGEEHYLKVNITLEVVNNEKVKEEVIKRTPQLRDLVISILRSKTKDKIDEEAGKEKLSGEINNKINSILGGAKVKHVYFEDFMIQ
jgi:flagellar FliL protein